VRSRYPNEELCGYALYSDADAITVWPSVNDRAHLEKVTAIDPDDAEYYRWSPAEWSHEFERAEYFQKISVSLIDDAKGLRSPQGREQFKASI
jgi:hypothetical protein